MNASINYEMRESIGLNVSTLSKAIIDDKKNLTHWQQIMLTGLNFKFTVDWLMPK